jgi:hypothetical protein
MMTNVFLGIGLHAVGGIAAATCYVPQKGTAAWSYQTYWLLFCVSGWLVMPIAVAVLTIPNLAQVLADVPIEAIVNTTVLGAIYGFGGMAFALGIRQIGFSLTYAIAIGISAVLGTVIPAILAGNLVSSFQEPGGGAVLTACSAPPSGPQRIPEYSTTSAPRYSAQARPAPRARRWSECSLSTRRSLPPARSARCSPGA